jgi:hypothetical protein
MSLSHDMLVGAWSLVDWRIEYGDGRVTRPYGKDAIGQLLYSADGLMSATVSAGTRPRLEQANARLASDTQKAKAFDGYFHYAGRWRIDGDTVVHSVELALNPDMTGTEQRRRARMDGANGLELSADEAIDEGSPRRHVLAWRRANR